MTLSKNQLPWWTWVLPILIFHLGTEVSLLFRYEASVGAIYLPTAFGLILIHWWGWKRVIPALYINAALSTPLWGDIDLFMWFIYPIGETAGVFLSWYFLTKVIGFRFWLPNTTSLTNYIIAGLLIPFFIDLTILQLTSTLYGIQPFSVFFSKLFRNLLGEVTAIFAISTIVLHFFSGQLKKRNLLYYQYADLPYSSTSIPNRFELLVIVIAIIILNFLIPFNKYWFIYGLASLYIALRQGFAASLIVNLVIFLVTYILPAFTIYLRNEIVQEEYLINIFAGNLVLYFFAALTGRIISDLRLTEKRLSEKNQELERTNEELDKFVYSASHDLSAPLKSIQGLVSLSKVDSSTEQRVLYLEKIDQSVMKLNDFIKEILDYSRNKRMTIKNEEIDVEIVCREILDNHKYLDGHDSIKIDTSDIEGIKIKTDSIRFKIIMTNLISNALKFKRPNELSPWIRIAYQKSTHHHLIIVEDNGEGIKDEHLTKIFEMFYRGNTTSQGSGLGLYIAAESASKINGSIRVESTYLKGSTFTLILPL